MFRKNKEITCSCIIPRIGPIFVLYFKHEYRQKIKRKQYAQLV